MRLLYTASWDNVETYKKKQGSNSVAWNLNIVRAGSFLFFFGKMWAHHNSGEEDACKVGMCVTVLQRQIALSPNERETWKRAAGSKNHSSRNWSCNTLLLLMSFSLAKSEVWVVGCGRVRSGEGMQATNHKTGMFESLIILGCCRHLLYLCPAPAAECPSPYSNVHVQLISGGWPHAASGRLRPVRWRRMCMHARHGSNLITRKCHCWGSSMLALVQIVKC